MQQWPYCDSYEYPNPAYPFPNITSIVCYCLYLSSKIRRFRNTEIETNMNIYSISLIHDAYVN